MIESTYMSSQSQKGLSPMKQGFNTPPKKKKMFDGVSKVKLNLNTNSYKIISRKTSPSDRFIPNRKATKLGSSYITKQFPIVQEENMEDLGQNNLEALYRKILIEGEENISPTFNNKNMFKFSNAEVSSPTISNNFSLKPLKISEKSPKRKISKAPFKVLDAPNLQDDYYLNLVDWSSKNLLAVGLTETVYLWDANSSQVSKLCSFVSDEVTAINWNTKGNLLAIGTKTGHIQFWDPIKMKKVQSFKQHESRIGTLSWNENLITSGSRDKSILVQDTRCKEPSLQYIGHKQEVCGLKWSFDGQMLASGGNDNKLFLWNLHSKNPLAKINDHLAAVKALAWSPHQHGLLASGGGTADRKIRFWNTNNFSLKEEIDTGSQVCNLMFSKNVNELVSTHGYSLNEIIVWRYPSLQKVSQLTGHSYRVLYLSMSPDGETIVTGAGDETLRFWNVFPPAKKPNNNNSLLMPKNHILR